MLPTGDLSKTMITSNRLVLRAFTATDAPDVFAGISPEITRFMSWNPPSSPDEFAAVWKAWGLAMSAGQDVQLVVRLSATGEFLGMSGLHGADGDLLETGIWIKSSAQQNGYGREAVAAVIDWASPRFKPSGFLYPVVDENMPSCRVAEALGGAVIGSCQRQKVGDLERQILIYQLPPTTPKPDMYKS